MPISNPEAFRFFITAGDPSADVYGARLMASIRRRIPTALFEGFGGPAMELEGLHSIARLSDVAVTGFWEVAKHYGFFRNLMGRCRSLMALGRYKAFIPVDYPGFNLRLSHTARENRIPVFWYVAPQLWAWGANRASKLARNVTALLVVFPFEQEFFRNLGVRTHYVGHPLLDEPIFSDVSVGGAGLVLLPGSRPQEILRHQDVLRKTVALLLRDRPDLDISVCKAPLISMDSLHPLTEVGCTVSDDSRAAMQCSAAGLVKAGTSSLEATLLGLPHSVFYKTSPLSYYVSRRLVTVNSVSMANLLLRQAVVQELIQDDATPEALSRGALQLLDDDTLRHQLMEASLAVRSMLGGPGAAERAADIIADYVVNETPS